MHIEIFPIKYEELTTEKQTKSSADIRKDVERARKIQLERYKKHHILFNSQLNGQLMKRYCKLGNQEKLLMEEAFHKLKLSARAYNRTIKLSRTIADLEGTSDIATTHIAEAIQYRNLDRKFWDS
ncbi:hypothetical protein [Crassaminicella profunda]|uniref:magnesium chelatase subunit ChlI family protein n=1 Tax=Crassaminicella profunda TaxID=1286698 RepID=UPI001FE40F00|nr:hypothetical protein [Crassaminicella profunda]